MYFVYKNKGWEKYEWDEIKMSVACYQGRLLLVVIIKYSNDKSEIAGLKPEYFRL